MNETESLLRNLYEHVFCVDNLRGYLVSIMENWSIDGNVANAARRAIAQRVPGGDHSIDDFYPPIVLSYSTEHRGDGVDAQNAGPGYIIVSFLIEYLCDNELLCYSDIMTPRSCPWKGTFCRRVEKAKVMVVLLTKRFFWSVHCLREVARAKRSQIHIVIVRLEDDLPSDREQMWADNVLEEYAKRQKNPRLIKNELIVDQVDARDALHGKATIPNRGTLLSDAPALGELVAEIRNLLPGLMTQPLLSKEQVTTNRDLDHRGRVIAYDFFVHGQSELYGSRKEYIKQHMLRILENLNRLLRYGDLVNGSEMKFTATPCTYEDSGRTLHLVKLKVDVKIKDALQRPDFADSQQLIGHISRLLVDLAEKVGATPKDMALLRLGTFYASSLVLLVEGPSSFFWKLLHKFHKEESDPLVLEGGTRVLGVAPAFLVSGPFQLWQAGLLKARAACRESSTKRHADIVLMDVCGVSLLLPTRNEALRKIVSSGVTNWRDPEDDAWKSLPRVEPLSKVINGNNSDVDGMVREGRTPAVSRDPDAASNAEEQASDRFVSQMSAKDDDVETHIATSEQSKPPAIVIDRDLSAIQEQGDNLAFVLPTMKDYLVGRESFCGETLGNELFRTLINLYSDDYEAAGGDLRRVLKEDIVGQITAAGGRFLKRVHTGGGQLEWVEMSYAEAMARVSTGFRHGRRASERSDLTFASVFDALGIDQHDDGPTSILADFTDDQQGIEDFLAVLSFDPKAVLEGYCITLALHQKRFYGFNVWFETVYKSSGGRAQLDRSTWLDFFAPWVRDGCPRLSQVQQDEETKLPSAAAGNRRKLAAPLLDFKDGTSSTGSAAEDIASVTSGMSISMMSIGSVTSEFSTFSAQPSKEH